MWWKKAAGPWNYGLANNAGSLTAGIFFRLNMEQQYVYSTVIPYEQSADGKAYWVPEEDITYPIGLFRQGKMWNRRGMWKKSRIIKITKRLSRLHKNDTESFWSDMSADGGANLKTFADLVSVFSQFFFKTFS